MQPQKEHQQQERLYRGPSQVFSSARPSLDGGYDLLLFVANWPARRAAQWRALLAARAIENQSWVVGVNVIGTDGAGVTYQGDSVVHDFMGERVLALESRAEVATHAST